MNRLNKKSGFSLVEILVAVGILAGAISSMMPLVNVSAMLSVEDEKLLQAVTLANNKMVEIEKDVGEDVARGKFPDESSEAGYFDPPFGDFKWESSMKKVEIPLASGGGEGETAGYGNIMKIISKEMSKAVREVKVKVIWGDREEDNEDKDSYTITTHLVNIKE